MKNCILKLCKSHIAAASPRVAASLAAPRATPCRRRRRSTPSPSTRGSVAVHTPSEHPVAAPPEPGGECPIRAGCPQGETAGIATSPLTCAPLRFQVSVCPFFFQLTQKFWPAPQGGAGHFGVEPGSPWGAQTSPAPPENARLHPWGARLHPLGSPAPQVGSRRLPAWEAAVPPRGAAAPPRGAVRGPGEPRLPFGLPAGTWAPATWPDWLCRICLFTPATLASSLQKHTHFRPPVAGVREVNKSGTAATALKTRLPPIYSGAPPLGSRGSPRGEPRLPTPPKRGGG